MLLRSLAMNVSEAGNWTANRRGTRMQKYIIKSCFKIKWILCLKIRRLSRIGGLQFYGDRACHMLISWTQELNSKFSRPDDANFKPPKKKKNHNQKISEIPQCVFTRSMSYHSNFVYFLMALYKQKEMKPKRRRWRWLPKVKGVKIKPCKREARELCLFACSMFTCT